MAFKRKTNHFHCCDEDEAENFCDNFFSVECYASTKKSFLRYFKDNIYLLCPSEDFFSPFVIESCTQEGIFPMACKISTDKVLPLLKLHQERCVVVLNSSALDEELSVMYPTSNHQYKKIVVKKKLLGEINNKLKSPALSVFINRAEDLYDVFRLIYRQHGEMWMCAKLRQCFVYMFQNPDLFQTKVIITAVRRVIYDFPKDVNKNEVKEGELVACEVGLLVGDIYTSCTGAFCLNGCGLLQLRITGEIMMNARCSVWDLGMYIDYKKEFLGTETMERKHWLKLVKYRRSKASAEDILGEIQNKYREGVNVQELIHPEGIKV